MLLTEHDAMARADATDIIGSYSTLSPKRFKIHKNTPSARFDWRLIWSMIEFSTARVLSVLSELGHRGHLHCKTNTSNPLGSKGDWTFL